MKQILCFLILSFFSSLLFTQNAPSVNNVNAFQRTDGSKIIDVFYDLLDLDGDTLKVTLQVSVDNGITYDIIPRDSLLSGDIGDSVMIGTGKHIIWQAGEETIVFEGSTYSIKVIARDDQYPPSPFVWCDIPAGDYTIGQYDAIQNISYKYQIMKYQVSNYEFVTYLEEALAASEIAVNGSEVQGYYPGDEYYGAGTYSFYSLGTPESPDYYKYGRISWNGSSFIINVSNGYSTGDFDNHPVSHVTWFGAWAFAEHYGLNLPTKYEWEKAARGLTGYDYPWGNIYNISGDRANTQGSGDPWDNGSTPVGYYDGLNGTTDSPSPFGVYDMCGNAYEWTDSWHSATYRQARGGHWMLGFNFGGLYTWVGSSGSPTDAGLFSGFRCIRTP